MSNAPLDRRRFVVGTAAALLALTHPRAASPLQKAVRDRTSRDPTFPLAPSWLPSSRLLQSLPRLLELAEVPGLGLGVVEQGRAWTRGFGRAVLEPRAAVTVDTVFEAVSLGKPLFAYAVLRLIDEGTIELDRPLYSYLPIPDANNPRMRRVTPGHVLSHTSGLANWRDTPGPLVPATDPGTQFSYSGEGFFYLQRVVEHLTGVPIARFMQERVLEPLGMRQSSYVWRDDFESRKAAGRDEQGREVDVYGAIGRTAEGLARKWGKAMIDWTYEDAARAVTLINPAWPVVPLYMMPSVAGSFLTTAPDYCRFLERLVAQTPGRGLDLAPATFKAMVTPQIELNQALSWGLGWGIQRDEYGSVLWHWGANNSFRNFVVADWSVGRAVVVFTNGQSGPKVYERVIAGITGRDHAAFLYL
jgi:CubicO group peptidase (beta-lactamase class C family)